MKKEDGLSEFMKFAYKCNKVKDLEEAFKEYPVEEEWHKGKVENILRENNEEYSLYEIGDIVFVKYYLYPDGKLGENHFFVIIDKKNIAIPIEYFGMLVSSKIEKIKYKQNKSLKADANNRLNKDSIVKTDVVYRISNNQILFKIGKVDNQRIEEYKNSFRKNNKM